MKNQNIHQLIEKYGNAKEKYYQGEPLMSDEEFDALEDQLVSLGFDPKVGYDEIDENEKVQHGQKMLSLGKRKVLDDEMELEMAKEIHSKYGDGTLSWKYDGLAINVRYKNGKLFSASTRGNGTHGRNVLYKVKHLIPGTIHLLDDIELRFEGVMKTKTFEEKYLDLDYSHPRNLVAGIIRDENENDSRLQDVDLVLLEAVKVESGEIIKDLTQFDGFIIKKQFIIVGSHKLKEVFDMCNKRRSEYTYPTDGLVYSGFDFKYFNHNDHHPDHAVSIKFKPPMLVSTITQISWKLQRTGNYTPIIHFEPLKVDGRWIKKASGYNLHYLIENDLCAGKQVRIVLSNDIIPIVKQIDN